MSVTEPLFLRVLRGEDAPFAPVWFMRQAGRFLPEYRALKEKHAFWTLARTPELAAEVTLQPVRRLGVDAAILFQDIMTPLPPMGVDIEFTPGPVIAEPIRTRRQIDALRVPEAEEIAPFVPAAIGLIRAACPVPLIGFGGAPLTLATYLVEGRGSKEYADFRVFLRTEPDAAHALLGKLTEVSIRYLTAQVRAGAQAIQLFDSWAGLHDRATWRAFAAPYNQRILQAVGALGVPRIYLAVGAGHLVPELAHVDCEAVSVDWRTPLSEVRRATGTRALQGNLDPAVLCAPWPVVEAAATGVLREGVGGPHVFNLGHGMMPGADPDVVRRLVDLVHGTSRRAG